MKRDDGVSWRGLGLVEKISLILIALWAVLFFAGIGQRYQTILGLTAVVMAVILLVKIGRMAMRNLIWSLRNRLIVAYLFIAVVPIVLLLALLLVTSYALVGQMAVYLVNREIDNRARLLALRAQILARSSRPISMAGRGPTPGAMPGPRRGPPTGRFGGPGRGPQPGPTGSIPAFGMRGALSGLQSQFPDLQILATGEQPYVYPEGARIEPPPEQWKNASGLVTRRDGNVQHLYIWAHSEQEGNEVTILAPITSEFLNSLEPGIGDITFPGYTQFAVKSHVPPAVNTLDLSLSFPYPVFVPSWEDPQGALQQLYFVVATRYSAVLGIIFGQKGDWSEIAMTALMVIVGIFFVVELVSLWAGVKLTRAITGAVHELYEGTSHVREGDFSYRIPVKGKDQVAELAGSFNTMTENLGRLIVVAKEKERLESELAIARDVQSNLFPKDVPFTRCLELKGVCSPARMVSGDYYDFMSLPGDSLAFAIGDVAGKGISAALLMATIQSTMRTQLSSANGTPVAGLHAAKMVSLLNRQLYATTSPEKYATFYFAIYDEQQHTLTYTNAGHLAPILLRGNDLEMLDSTGTVVGAFPSAVYEERTVSLVKGDMLVAYTDGIVEPENAYGEMFGEDRLKDLVVKYSRADSAELIARTMEAVKQWTGAGELQDDMTMVVARHL